MEKKLDTIRALAFTILVGVILIAALAIRILQNLEQLSNRIQ